MDLFEIFQRKHGPREYFSLKYSANYVFLEEEEEEEETEDRRRNKGSAKHCLLGRSRFRFSMNLYF